MVDRLFDLAMAEKSSEELAVLDEEFMEEYLDESLWILHKRGAYKADER